MVNVLGKFLGDRLADGALDQAVDVREDVRVIAQMNTLSWAATFAQQGQYAYEDPEAVAKQRLAAFRRGLGK